MIDYGKIRKPPKQVKDNVWVHETEVWFDKKNDHSNILIEEHRKTSVQTLLGDLVEAAALAKTTPITIEIRHDHSNFPKLLVLWYKKK